MKYEEVMKQLKSLSNPKNVEGMARFGISPENTYGVSIPNLRKIVKEIKNINSKSAKWIASDAIKELTSEAIQKRLKK